MVWVLALVVASRYGRPGRAVAAVADGVAQPRELPFMTVVITAHDQAGALRSHLPQVLGQDYPSFEVIVVDMASADDTSDVLESLEFQHTNLRHTYTPSSARDISIEYLALTLGIRGARGEWVVFTTADAEPASPHWLMAVAGEASDQRAVLVGPVRYAEGAPRYMHFRRLWDTIFAANHILSRRAAAVVPAANVAIRRDALLETLSTAQPRHSGVDGPALYRHGVLGLIANRVANPDKALATRLSASGIMGLATSLLPGRQAIVVETHPHGGDAWRQHRIATFEARRHLRRAFRYKASKSVAAAMPWLLLVAMASPWGAIAADAQARAAFDAGPDALTAFWRGLADGNELMIAAAVLAVCELIMLTAYISVKLMAVAATARAFAMPANPVSFLFRELMLPFAYLRLWWQWWRTPRREFRKKFV